MFNSSTKQYYNGLENPTDLLSTFHPAQSLDRSSLLNCEPALRESCTSQNPEARSSFFRSVFDTIKSYFSSNNSINSLDYEFVSNEVVDTDALDSSEQFFPLSNQYNRIYGDGLANAAAAVARAIKKSPFRNVPNYGGYNWGLDAIQAPEVWARGYTGKDVVVAVIDTGVDFTHADLDKNIWVNRGEVFGNGIDDDCNGYVDDVIGWNFVDNNNNPMDYDGHGTHVAGIIAAENNSFGTIGVAFDSKIMPIRVLGDNGGTSRNVAKGIIYAADNGADVINLSLGAKGYSSEIAEAVRYATEQGSIVVMAAGNDGAPEPYYPAHLATHWGIAVGAIDYTGYVADFSNQAGSDPKLRYVVAPGVDIYSTFPNNDYEFMSGTSMAAPFVSGIAALMLSANPYLSPEQTRQILAGTAIG